LWSVCLPGRNFAERRKGEKQMSIARSYNPEQPDPASLPVGADLWPGKTLAELEAEQSVEQVARIEDLLGQGADLWADDAEFDQFLTWLQDCRQQRR
jgi:hypothetical protein